MCPKTRAYWDEAARNDKLRYEQEKKTYRGPWNVTKRRAKKHPLAPKRPMSAFLKFSQTRRAMVKQANPDMSNTDVSRLLGEMWRNASSRETTPYVEEEEKERAVYKEVMANGEKSKPESMQQLAQVTRTMQEEPIIEHDDSRSFEPINDENIMYDVPPPRYSRFFKEDSYPQRRPESFYPSPPSPYRIHRMGTEDQY
eukprot:CAMPEP_0118716136 /NCGR_PEP_ID=MMETSP0800-20121206/27317_1 /TAXON_ID=210618 ORGANISM="Striatella unipunctata, Strain CCMP2910" /NCGR_SAMPLE_ID=MMETSP0800 /ASSEMBLY_ACC=CAM_ASM_000638 /LENGTH=197 /DNA_ID=CAMNT_0006622491 /DNA_START=209 /DNA_END=800 /DNA_ORIENTATION=+